MSTQVQTALPPAAGRSGIAEDFGTSLGVLMRAYRAMVASVLDCLPHGPRGYQTLCKTVRGDQPSQLALANCLGIDRTVMTYLIDDLVAAGLVTRELNPADRRQRKIVATPLGISTLVELQRQVRKAEDRLLSALDASERETFRSLLGRAADAVRDTDLAIAPCEDITDIIATAPDC